MSDVNEDLGLPEGQRPTDPTAQRSTTFLVGEVSSGIPVALTARGTVSTVRTTPSSLSSSLSSTEEGSIPCPASVPVANPNFASSGRDDGDGGCSSGSAKTWLTGGRNRQQTTNEWIYVREERSNDSLEARSKVVDREREREILAGWFTQEVRHGQPQKKSAVPYIETPPRIKSRFSMDIVVLLFAKYSQRQKCG